MRLDDRISFMRLKTIFKEIGSLFILVFAVFLACFGITAFLIPNGLIDGGVTGLSMLISQVVKMPLAYMILIVNIPFVLIGVRETKKSTLIKGVISIFFLAFFLHEIHFPTMTDDLLLSSLFGGIFLGAGIGLSIRGGGVLDGTEILALMLNKRLHITVGDVILIFNVCIFSCALLFIPIESVMYSILAYFSASKAVDFLIYGIDEFIGLTIISSKTSEIKNAIIHEMGLAATLLHGKRGYSDNDQEVIFCVLNRFQVGKFKSRLLEIDPNVFFITQKVSDTSGGLLRSSQYFGRVH